MRTRRPVTVYLDSSDFSHLSDPRATASLRTTRDRLLALARNENVRFVFSAAHMSEMAPVEARHAHYATERTDLLVALCRRNCLVSFDRLMKAEVSRLTTRSTAPVEAIVDDGTWFPDIAQIVTPVQALGAANAVKRAGQDRGLNRKQRRTLQGSALKGGRFRPRAIDDVAESTLDDILRVYPMRRQDADVLLQFMAGRASAAQAEEAFLESLRDPSWMMRWFADHHDRLGQIGEWVRGPARNRAAQMAKAAEAVTRAMEAEERNGGRSSLAVHFTAAGWGREQDTLLLSAVKRLIDQEDALPLNWADATDVDTYCPGISTGFRVMHSSLRSAFGARARTPGPSDFVDAVHAMYAPYVDLFRSDRYMSPITARHATKYNTEVVAKIEDVPSRVEALLART
ncbi:hypothetical protein LK996_01205 [Lysobacter sp. A6]|uniref:DUF4935 domain-containing protein n=1 Tax=Noviluteimonas lactosilytica TaxID=2888523 RepID=A0ABS8JDL6_9GAMM|nr:hypothetical protein [Lysobacter lactosilyticus]MCC8361702.1 hypothetical protein [Lysobacter lactosilyticus]